METRTLLTGITGITSSMLTQNYIEYAKHFNNIVSITVQLLIAIITIYQLWQKHNSKKP